MLLAAIIVAVAWSFAAGAVDSRRPDARRVLGAVLIVFVVVAGAAWGISLIETASTVVDTHHTGLVVNELLAPANGLHPLAGYAALYMNLVGYVLVPFVRLGVDPASAAVLLITVSVFVVLGVLLLTFVRVGMSALSALVVLVLVVALTAVSQVSADFPTPTGRIHRDPADGFYLSADHAAASGRADARRLPGRVGLSAPDRAPHWSSVSSPESSPGTTSTSDSPPRWRRPSRWSCGVRSPREAMRDR